MLTVDFDYFPLQPGDTVLDLGCGEGRHVISAFLEQDITAIGVDLSLRDISVAQQRFEDFRQQNKGGGFGLSVANALKLPFADDTFDKVICSEVLEHIDDYEGVLKEINRVLKPGGLFCASVPRSWPERICWYFSDAYHKVEGGHLRIFDARELNTTIQSHGFTYFKRHWAHALHSPFWWLRCMLWDQQETHWLIQQYHRFLVWDLMDRPRLTRLLEKLLNPIMGKSVVMYYRKRGSAIG